MTSFGDVSKPKNNTNKKVSENTCGQIYISVTFLVEFAYELGGHTYLYLKGAKKRFWRKLVSLSVVVILLLWPSRELLYGSLTH